MLAVDWICLFIGFMGGMAASILFFLVNWQKILEELKSEINNKNKVEGEEKKDEN